MRRFGIPLAPAINGAILGPMAESHLRRALQLGNGDPAVLVTTPLSITLYAILALVLLASIATKPLAAWLRARRPPSPQATEGDFGDPSTDEPDNQNGTAATPVAPEDREPAKLGDRLP